LTTFEPKNLEMDQRFSSIKDEPIGGKRSPEHLVRHHPGSLARSRHGGNDGLRTPAAVSN
jgi:hypothetical protein